MNMSSNKLMLKGIALIAATTLPLVALLIVLSVGFWGRMVNTQQLLYITLPDLEHNASLYLHDLAHDVRVPILDTLGWESHAAWSPDGNRIVYSAFGDHPINHDLFIYDLTTDETTQITAGEGDFNKPAWSPDGTRIIYEGKMPSNTYDLFLYDVATGETQNLAISDDNQRDPVWSSGGQQIMFTEFSTQTVTSNIVTYDLVSGETHIVMRIPSFDITHQSTVDGSQIALTVTSSGGAASIYVGGRTNLFITDTFGDERQLLLSMNNVIDKPAWSPDSTTIAFEARLRDDDFDQHIYVIHTDSEGEFTRITEGSVGYTSAEWRP